MQLSTLKGIGPKTEEKLATLGITSVEDVLFHLPFRYQDRTRVVSMVDLRPGDQAVITGTVVSCQMKFGRKRQLHVVVEDGTGTITLKFFHFSKAQQNSLAVGTALRCFGEVKLWQRQLMIIHPEYQMLSGQETPQVAETLTPVYPSTDGMQQSSWRKLSEQSLHFLADEKVVHEILPTDIRQTYQLSAVQDALQFVHRPPPDAEQTLLEEGLHPMQQRLAFEELLAHQVSLRQLRAKVQQHQAQACAAEYDNSAFLQNLGFALTGAQQNAVADITDDLKQSNPMMRLVQGDVGSGKTVVAGLAALQVIAAGFQVAIMAPTELLAEQHYQQFSQWLQPLGLQVAWLSGKLKAAERREMEALVVSGEAKLVVGTHALFQKSVNFATLALVIIDEQHRFGVAQRSALRAKGVQGDIYPHQLIMTATPIPRTLAMTVYADLDTSVIDELPPGRTPINTVVVNNQRRNEVIKRAEEICRNGGQVYWVCPLIEESEVLECEAAEKIAAMLQQKMSSLKVGLVHGRMKSVEKQQLMQAFKDGSIDVLVATTVIEVGINVPNATLMIIENAERMGLAQLHQLRGRVGRGAKESHCVLLYQDPLSENARRRLTTMRESTDGFYIAQQDLELRGPGEVMGTRQTGMQRLHIANIMRDRKLLPQVQAAAKTLLQQHPDTIEPLLHRWLGFNVEFGKV